MMQENNKTTLEEHFSNLDEIIRRMEQPSVTLDQSFDLYKKGLIHIKEANSMLDDMEKAMLVLSEDGSLEEFE